MSKVQRDKGKRGELQLARAIEDQLGVRLERNLVQWRNGGTDLVPAGDPETWGPIERELDRWAIEVKAQAMDTARRQWWGQAVSQAQIAGARPMLAVKIDYRPWRVIVPLSALGAHLDHEQWEHTAELSLIGWCGLVRERALGFGT